MFDSFLFDNWKNLLWIVLMGVIIYPTFLIIFRIFGKRSLTQVNMFDFIITVAYGNTLASILIIQSISYTEGVLLIFMLAVLQFIFSKLQTKFKPFWNLTKAKPIYLYSQGDFNQEAMKRERLKFEDLRSAVRKQGMVSFQQLDALILEGDGTITAVKKGDGSVPESVSDVMWKKKSEKTLK
ncbi:DUF421 domain-containing protein [Aquibacillus rhizosphaerae]|uniref:DUF421 domain-containing protein n=1 Tax=Aquibacillus rhizosphaerae TaxID=3051431 RepID=A0ABT7L272_9BACI|nr:YetF domain-containing protein [Aquibacillus sp. LR5S19]MDL4839956.1 DUF421 domain-containing protein [Aquibacillus sp. LR5S19]